MTEEEKKPIDRDGQENLSQQEIDRYHQEAEAENIELAKQQASDLIELMFTKKT